jgi:hypothetical protein
MPRGAKPKEYPQALVERVAVLYGAGKTQAEVAADVGVTQKVIWRLMQRHGIAARVAAKRDQFGDRNHAWKGDEASKYAFHRRLYSRFGPPRQCAQCGTTTAQHYDYANLSGRYEDVSDYAPMCRSCHWKYDEKINNIRRAAPGKEGCHESA